MENCQSGSDVDYDLTGDNNIYNKSDNDILCMEPLPDIVSFHRVMVYLKTTFLRLYGH